MSDIELAIRWSKKLESLLGRLGAAGRGLHEKVSSVERKLPDPLVRKLRFIATVRNKVVHDDEYHRIDDRAGFDKACKEAETQLRKMAGVKPAGRRVVWSVLLALAVALIVYWLIR